MFAKLLENTDLSYVDQKKLLKQITDEDIKVNLHQAAADLEKDYCQLKGIF